MRSLIVTTDPTTLTWKSLEKKRQNIENALNTTKDGLFEVSIEYKNVVPEVENGRITHSWFDSFSYPLYRAGYDFISLHMSNAQRTAFGIEPNLRGSSQNDTDFVAETYFWADENTKRNGYNQFVETCLHEISHEISRGTGVPDTTHQYHNRYGSIKGIFKKYDMSSYLPRMQVLKKEKTRLEKVLESLKQMVRSERVQPFFTQSYPVTQHFGVKNPLYKLTGIHIGTDIACPIGTEIHAPLSGNVTEVGKGTQVGNYCLFKTTRGTYRFCHLSSVRPVGYYSQGSVIATSGNTGMSTGPHLHVELWKGLVDVSKLTRTNVTELLLDVTKIQ